MDRIAVIVLPGLDGCGDLRSRFAEALGDAIEPVLVSYPPLESLGYAELLTFVEAVTARHERYVLVGESFSGPLACMLAAQRPKGLIGLVLCATFSRPPRPKLHALVSLFVQLPIKLVPGAALSWLLFGSWSKPELVALLKRAVRSSDSVVLQHRAIAAMSVDVRSILTEIYVPVVCLCGSSDRAVPSQASESLCAGIPNATLASIEGPHALLQAVPEACAARVRNFVESVSDC